MFDWLNGLFTWFANWIPQLIIVPSTHEGVKFRHGKHVIRMKSGLHAYWPVVTTWVMYPIVRQTHDLEPQSLTTKDGVDIVISTAVVCEIHDIVLALANNFELNETIGDIARGTVAEVTLSHTFEEIFTAHETLEEQISEALNAYGVTVLAVKIVELSRTRTIRLIGATNGLP
jgi:regulator of protease activity HflC (stomatin/prohibitin superfamily)